MIIYTGDIAEAEAEALEAKDVTGAAVEACSEDEEEVCSVEDKTDNISRRNIIFVIVRTTSRRNTLSKNNASRTTSSAKPLLI